MFIIRRPVGSRRFKYDCTRVNENWTINPFEAYRFISKKGALDHLRNNKDYYAPDDEVVEIPDEYNGSICPYCNQGKPRNVGIEHNPGVNVIIDIQCNYCNIHWQELYLWIENVHILK